MTIETLRAEIRDFVLNELLKAWLMKVSCRTIVK